MGQGNSQTFGLSPPSCLRFTIRPEEVATHQPEDDCWVIVGNLVLDCTEYLAQHPGGKQAILNCAGTDATTIFDLVHHRGIIKKYGLREGTIALKGVIKQRVALSLQTC
ncbi:Cytochrome b2 [Durusdinium trenchii]|uniref:Mitochondrial (L-lactate dehydrogenase [Cytochrome]) (L-lactate ferricytochrome C oxidoreductase) (L-LCR) n=1 Tax=Durusdinium trenchii TaxID=1381693 RepID=A0ABP0JS55_9DINO